MSRALSATADGRGAIVFTDIVGFTELTDEHGDDVALALLERQEVLVRDALPRARARREGARRRPAALVRRRDRRRCDTCLALQQRFEKEAVEPLPLWVRIGMHWGSPRRRGDDIVGRDVNLAARIVDLAGPGEVLCSEATADEVGAIDGIEYEPLGPVFVRGFADPVPLVRAVVTT